MSNVVTFRIYKGKYFLGLTKEARQGEGYHSWNYARTKREYPDLVAHAALLGCNNKSRDFYGQGLGYKLKPRNAGEAYYLRKYYTDVAKLLNKYHSI